MSKILISFGFLIIFHTAYLVSKSIILNNNYFFILDKNLFYNESNIIDFNKFPLEILLEMIISFLFITLGSLNEYANFEEIYIDKQKSDKVVKHFDSKLFNYMCSKGGMLNHYLK